MHDNHDLNGSHSNGSHSNSGLPDSTSHAPRREPRRGGLHRFLVACFACLVGASLFFAGQAFTEDHKEGDAKKEEGQAPDPMAMMQYLAQVHAPGEHQKALARLEGTWDAKSKFWMAPGQPPVESKGVSKNKMAYGGRYLEIHYEGDMGGQPFKGYGLVSHDNYKKEYQHIWIDDAGMSSGMSMQRGSSSEDKSTITFKGEWNGGKYGTVPTRMTYTFKDADHFTLESWGMHPGPDGKPVEVKEMEITYARRK